MIRILIVEDDISISELVSTYLTIEGFECSQAVSAVHALNITSKEKFDLILLDVNLPDMDGFTLFERLGESPVIFITARDDIMDKLKGFQCGAEDYIVKPFDLNELLARIKVVLRRTYKETEVKLVHFAGLSVDFSSFKVMRDGNEIKLSNQEFELLKTMYDNKNQVLSRAQLLELAWGRDYDGDLRTVDVHVRRLREKLNLHNDIVTVFKQGYRLEI